MTPAQALPMHHRVGLFHRGVRAEFEVQADQFAHQKLTTLGKSPTAFADALKALAKAHDIEPGDEQGLLQYFSSHPAIAERIKHASN